ncbi:E3 ubiquitin-protein ligase Arkadia-like isoform X2 [Portunus trituberculatus]|uniref:E3 ubiquitin-protein ligase Arkadia-like isoform X2 n=1 Tax=Portunus trituberculatus TaxID=210409 RepID=UPI001E1CC77F|nr:E3 ubiquitin-protein ligase Arkadia-like isoform X2 [Portunus trituberculatus]
MYTGSGISKETQHISPHIAAHKSSLAPTSSVSSITSVAVNSGGLYDLAHHPANKSAFNTHIPTYKVGMHQPHHSIVKGLDHDGASLLGRHGHVGLPTHHSKSAPQDLSAHASGTEKALPLELTPHSSAHHKPLPHIQSVVSQGGSHIGGLVPAHQPDRGAPYFRMPDSVINVQGPSAVLVSSGGEGASSTPHSMAHTTTMVHAGSTHSGATNLTTMSAVSMACTMPGGVASSISQSHLMPNDCSAVSSVSTGGVIPHPDLRGVKKEKAEQLEGMAMAAGQRDGCHPQAGPQRDLVRQALQAVVTNPQHKTELLMMNIQVNASLQAMNKGNGNDHIPPDNESDEVVMLQPAEVNEANSLSLMSQNPKRRRPKLSEEAQAERRVRIALRMREKRATESDEQKRLRRIREAERMRRKRATEDEDQKVKRRLEAANRARSRRATMTMQEREADRRRAAERMRLRRATESPESKSVRRVRAAERMRKRRASETPEQRAQRRQNIAVRMKARRKRKSEESINDGDELTDMDHSVDNRLVKSETSRSVTQQESSSNVTANHTAPQVVTSSPHIFVPSTIGVGSGSIAVLHVDSPLPPMSVGHPAAPGLSTVDMAQLGQPLSLQKSSSASQDQKHAMASQGTGTSTSTQETSSLSSLLTGPHSTLEPLSLHKASSYHHHIPHFLHYHQPHSSSLQQHPHHHPHHHHHHHHHNQQRHQHQ